MDSVERLLCVGTDMVHTTGKNKQSSAVWTCEIISRYNFSKAVIYLVLTTP
jgi:hypothetical protein